MGCGGVFFFLKKNRGGKVYEGWGWCFLVFVLGSNICYEMCFLMCCVLFDSVSFGVWLMLLC